MKRSIRTEYDTVHRGRPYYIVDGYNVILGEGAFRKSGDVEGDRDSLIRLLEGYAAKKRVDITVVWDGSGIRYSPRKGRTWIRSIYSTPFRKADDKIIRMVQRIPDRGRVIVVSDDRRHIIGVVRDLGAGTMTVARFLSLVGFRGGKKNRTQPRTDEGREQPPADDLTVEQWLELFRSRDR